MRGVCLWCRFFMKISLHHIISNNNRMIWIPWLQWLRNLEEHRQFNNPLIMADSINFPWFLYRSSLWAGMEWIYKQLGVLLVALRAWNNHLYIMICTILSHLSNNLWINHSHFSLIKKITYPLTKLISLKIRKPALI